MNQLTLTPVEARSATEALERLVNDPQYAGIAATFGTSELFDQSRANHPGNIALIAKLTDPESKDPDVRPSLGKLIKDLALIVYLDEIRHVGTFRVNSLREFLEGPVEEESADTEEKSDGFEYTLPVGLVLDKLTTLHRSIPGPLETTFREELDQVLSQIKFGNEDFEKETTPFKEFVLTHFPEAKVWATFGGGFFSRAIVLSVLYSDRERETFVLELPQKTHLVREKFDSVETRTQA